LVLQRNAHKADEQGREREARDPEKLPFGYFSVPPPLDDKNDHRQSPCDSFAPQGSDKKHVGKKISGSQISEERQKTEASGKEIFPLGDPGNRFDMNGMQGEQKSDQQRVLQFQMIEQTPNQKSVDGVQEAIHKVVAGGMESPKMKIKPKAGIGQGIILGKTSRMKPYFSETGKASQRQVLGHIVIIVPDELAMDSPEVDTKRGTRKKERLSKHTVRRKSPESIFDFC